MEKIFSKSLKKIVKRMGYDIHKNIGEYPQDYDESDIEIIENVKPFTMTSIERIHTLIQSIKYIKNNQISGSIVECGVWKGGSMMAIIQTLKKLNDISYPLYLFDTFEGMPKPSNFDVSSTKISAKDEFIKNKINDESSTWCNIGLDDVKKNIYSQGYDNSKITFVKGKVESTLPFQAPNKISLLRLDTDWYESTKHELECLFPLLSKGGVLIIDDYGYWEGARKAVDEYFLENEIMIFLNRIDNTGRIGIKI